LLDDAAIGEFDGVIFDAQKLATIQDGLTRESFPGMHEISLA
jgi:hypothetical protein